MVTQSRRPIEDDELPYLRALGARLRSLRTAAGMSRVELSTQVMLSASHIGCIERAERRTRRSTLRRVLVPLVDPAQLDDVLDELVEIADRALAPESDYEARIEKRRLRRERKRQHAALAKLAPTLAQIESLDTKNPDLARIVDRVKAETRGIVEAHRKALDTEPSDPGDAASSTPLTPLEELRAELRTVRRTLVGGLRGKSSAETDRWLNARQREREIIDELRRIEANADDD